MSSRDEAHINFEGQKKRGKVRKIIKEIGSFIEYVFTSHMSYMYTMASPDSDLIKPIQKLINDDSIYFVDCNNNIITKHNVLIHVADPYTRKFYFYTLINKEKYRIWIVEDPANPIHFAPKMVPFIGECDLIVDFAKIELLQVIRPYYNYNREVYLRYSFGYTTDLDKKKYFEFRLDHYPLDPIQFQYRILCEVRSAYRRWQSEQSQGIY